MDAELIKRLEGVMRGAYGADPGGLEQDLAGDDEYTGDRLRRAVATIAALVAEECAKEADDEERIRSDAGAKHPEDSESRGRCFAGARAATNIAWAIRRKFKEPDLMDPKRLVINDQDLIDKLLTEAGVIPDGSGDDILHGDRASMRRLVALVADECAKVCDETFVEPGDIRVGRCSEAAAAIRGMFRELTNG